MASRMTKSYRPQAAQMNKEPPWERSLNLTLTQHLCDEDPKLQEMRPSLKVELPWTWYYWVFLNSHTLVILLQVDPTFGDELEIVCEIFYKIENTLIFAWSSIPSVGHYHWLCYPIHQLPLNNKAKYLVCTIQCILNFL